MQIFLPELYFFGDRLLLHDNNTLFKSSATKSYISVCSLINLNQLIQSELMRYLPTERKKKQIY